MLWETEIKGKLVLGESFYLSSALGSLQKAVSMRSKASSGGSFFATMPPPLLSTSTSHPSLWSGCLPVSAVETKQFQRGLSSSRQLGLWVEPETWRVI